MQKLFSFIMLGVFIFASSGCGKSNIFSFAHSGGSNTSTKALSADASAAFQNKDFNKALDYYKKILESDPNNSQAIYGYAASELAVTGMDIASLVANLVTTQNSSQTVNRLSPAISYAAHSSGSSSTLLPQAIINNRGNIEIAVNDVLNSKHLLKIIQGKADGTIAPDNPDVNVNIAFCLVLWSALKVYDSHTVNFDSNYNVTVSGTPDPAVTTLAGKDIASAYQRLRAVAKKLNLASDSTINNINNDVNDLFNDLKTQTNINVDINTDYYLRDGTY